MSNLTKSEKAHRAHLTANQIEETNKILSTTENETYWKYYNLVCLVDTDGDKIIIFRRGTESYTRLLAFLKAEQITLEAELEGLIK